MTLSRLNFPEYQFSLRQNGGKTEVFDIARKKFVALTSEEWVRQHVIHYLHNEKKCPLELVQVEGSITVNSLPKRCDIIVYDKLTRPSLLVECKKTDVKIQQKTFDQALVYNLVLNVPYILITNGLQHVCFSFDKTAGHVVFHNEIPDWHTLCSKSNQLL